MNKLLLTLILACGLLTQCSRTPVACFTLDRAQDSLQVNVDVTFTAVCSDDAEEFNWNFGDNQLATGTEVKHKYAAPDTYTVTLTAVNGSKSDTKTDVVIVR
jgi:PKD repeat protein